MRRFFAPVLVALVAFGCSGASSSDSSEADVTQCSGGCISWTHQFGSESLIEPLASAVTTGPQGTFAIGGQTSGGKDQFGCGTVQTSDHAAYVARFDAWGHCAWHHEILPTGQPGWSSRAATEAIGIDAEGRVTIAATVNYTVDPGGGAIGPAGSNPDSAEVLVAQYDANGKFRWAKRFGAKATGNGVPDAAPTALRVTSGGDILVTGSHGWAIAFDHYDLPSSGSAFVARFSPDGDLRWAKEAGSEVRLWDVAVTADDHTIVAGDVGDYYVFGGEGSHTVFGKTVTVPKGGDSNLLVASLTSTGKTSWVKGFDGMVPHLTPSPGAEARSVAVDGDGSVVVAGTLSGEVTFAGTKLAPANDQGYTSYVARFSKTGTPVSGLVWQDRDDVRLTYADDKLQAVSGSPTSGLFVSELDKTGVVEEVAAKGAHATVQAAAGTDTGSLLVLVGVDPKGGTAFHQTFVRGQAAFLFHR